MDQLQLKVFEEKKNKWYKNPSLLLSIIALTSSLVFSVRSIVENSVQKTENKETSTITTIKGYIEELMEEEKKYYQVFNNPTVDITSKNNAGMFFEAKSGNLIDKILKVITKKNIEDIEPNLLLNYGRFLTNKGKFEESKEAFEKAIEKSRDEITIGICLRSLGNIYSNPSFSQFDSLKSRKYRNRDVCVAQAFKGEARDSYLSRSYETWCIDEYYFIKNTVFGNKLLDSARYFTNLLPDVNQFKKPTLDRLDETFNYYNDILVPRTLSGEYFCVTSDGKTGVANIVANSYGYSIDVEFMDNNTLSARLKGSGAFTDLNHVKFDVTNESKVGSGIASASGTLNLKPLKNRKLTGSFFEFGKESVGYILTKK